MPAPFPLRQARASDAPALLDIHRPFAPGTATSFEADDDVVCFKSVFVSTHGSVTTAVKPQQ